MTRCVRFLPDAPPQARRPVIELPAQDMVQPRELGGDLPGAEVQVRS